MKEYKRIMRLIESQDRLSDYDRLKLALVCLESALDQLGSVPAERNACADMLKRQRKIWQERERWNKRNREHYAQAQAEKERSA